MQSEEKGQSKCEFARDFIERLRYIRNKNKISAREMSISLGQNVNYINLIENGKRMPSMQGFFSICEYLNITPSDFFAASKETESHVLQEEITEIMSSLTISQVQSILAMIQEFKKP